METSLPFEHPRSVVLTNFSMCVNITLPLTQIGRVESSIHRSASSTVKQSLFILPALSTLLLQSMVLLKELLPLFELLDLPLAILFHSFTLRNGLKRTVFNYQVLKSMPIFQASHVYWMVFTASETCQLEQILLTSSSTVWRIGIAQRRKVTSCGQQSHLVVLLRHSKLLKLINAQPDATELGFLGHFLGFDVILFQVLAPFELSFKQLGVFEDVAETVVEASVNFSYSWSYSSKEPIKPTKQLLVPLTHTHPLGGRLLLPEHLSLFNPVHGLVDEPSETLLLLKRLQLRDVVLLLFLKVNFWPLLQPGLVLFDVLQELDPLLQHVLPGIRNIVNLL